MSVIYAGKIQTFLPNVESFRFSINVSIQDHDFISAHKRILCLHSIFDISINGFIFIFIFLIILFKIEEIGT